MDIITTARHFELTPEIREYARKRIEKLQRLLERVEEVHLVLATEKYRQIAEVTLHARGAEIVSREESDDMQISIDHVVERVERQMKRLDARRKDRKQRRAATPRGAGGPETIEEESEAEVDEIFSPVVVRQEGFHAEPITVEQAIEELNRRRVDFLLFQNGRSGRVALVHLMHDGNFGLVEAL
jgi:putative sigma-54 modulation protein